MTTVSVGATLEPVLIGPPVNGRVTTWRGSEPTRWRLADTHHAALVGCGRLARTEREPTRYREVVLLADDGSGLWAMERPTAESDGSASGATVALATEQLESAGDDQSDDVGDDAWSETATWLTGVVKQAEQRGEFVVLERGGWSYEDVPYVMAFPSSGDAVMHLERAPAAVPAQLWPPAATEQGQSISAPLTPANLDVVGLLLVGAARTWASSPHDLGVTFARAPDR
jgi:hypothetical protein